MSSGSAGVMEVALDMAGLLENVLCQLASTWQDRMHGFPAGYSVR